MSPISSATSGPRSGSQGTLSGAEDLYEMGAEGVRRSAGRDGESGKEAAEPSDAESDGADGAEPPADGEAGYIYIYMDWWQMLGGKIAFHHK